MKNGFKAIPVLDGNGDQLTLYEIREKGPFLGLATRKRYELGTGEVVQRSGNDFVVQTTGEKLTRLRKMG